jgi:hypothetical protein
MGQSKGCLVKSVPGTEDGKKRAWHRRLAPKIGTEDQGCLHGCRAPKIAGHRRSHKGCQARLALGIVPGDAWQPVLDSPNWQKACLAPKIGTEDWHRRLAPKIGTEDWHRRLAPKIGTEDWHRRLAPKIKGAYTGAGCLHGCRAPKIGHRRSRVPKIAQRVPGTSGARYVWR